MNLSLQKAAGVLDVLERCFSLTDVLDITDVLHITGVSLGIVGAGFL